MADQIDIDNLARSVDDLVRVLGNRSPASTPFGGDKSSFNPLSKATGVIDKGALALSASFDAATPSIGAFTSKFANTSQAVAALGQPIDAQVKNFRQLSSVGVDFGQTLFESRNKAAEANLSLDTYSKTVAENAPSLALAFGTASQGAEKFAEMSGTVMKKAGKELAGLGFTMDEISEYSASYIEQMTYAGRAQTMTVEELAAGSMRYQMELDKLSKATGLSRKQIDEANQARQRDVRMRLALQKMDDKEAAHISARMAQLDKMDPTGKLSAGFKDLIAGGGVAMTEEARSLTLAMNAAGVDIKAITSDIYNGQAGSAAKLDQAMQRVGEHSNTMGDAQRRLVTATSTMGQTIPQYTGAMLSTFSAASDAVETASEEQANALKKSADGLSTTDPTRGALAVDQTLVQVQNSLAQTFLETGVMGGVTQGLTATANGAQVLSEKFYELGTSVEGIDSMSPEKAYSELMSTMRTQFVDKFLTPAEREANKAKEPPPPPLTKEESQARASTAAQKELGITEAQAKEPLSGERAIEKFEQIQDDIKSDLLNEGLKKKDIEQPSENLGSFFGKLWDKISGGSNEAVKPEEPATPPVEMNFGTMGAFGSLIKDFGKGTPAMLHGEEAVMNKGQLEDYTKNIFDTASNMMGSIKDMPSKMNIGDIGSKFKDIQTPMMTAMNDMATNLKLPAETPPTDVATETKKPVKDFNETVVERLDQLNTMIATLVQGQDQSNRYQNKLVKTSKENLMA